MSKLIPFILASALCIAADASMSVTGGATITGGLSVDDVHVGRGGSAVAGNTAVGYSALTGNTTGGANTAIGYYAMPGLSTGWQNTAVGYDAGSGISGGASDNAVFGNGAGRAIGGSSANTALGSRALQLGSGARNTVIGAYVLPDATSGDYNVAIGYNSGDDLTTGSYNTIIGSNVVVPSGSLSNNVIIADGQGNQRINVDSSGRVGLGALNTSYQLTVNGSAIATAWDISSDRRLKKNIRKLESPLNKILQLQAVSFDWDENMSPLQPSSKEDIGLIAQDVEKIFPELVTTGKNGYKSISYSKLVSPLVGALQDIHAENMELKKSVETLLLENARLQKKVDALANKLE